MEKRGKKEHIKNNSIYIKGWILIILVILLAVSIYFYIPKNCKNDEACYAKYAQTCSKAKVGTYKEGNLFNYEIKGKQSNNCIFSIKMEKMKEGSNQQLVELLEGRQMLCQVPLDKFKEKPLLEIKDSTDYCSGPLKEAMLQLTIERLYSVIISNLGNITAELRKVA